MTNKRKQSALSKARSFKHSFLILHEQVNLVSFRGVDFTHFNTCCTFKVENVAEGEAQRYFDHAITLRDTIRFLRFNKELTVDLEYVSSGQGIDLLRCESLLGLEPATCSRVLNKNYSLLVSMAPLSNEIRPISSCTPQHIGPAIPEVCIFMERFIFIIRRNRIEIYMWRFICCQI